jgi:hypothetical protein
MYNKQYFSTIFTDEELEVNEMAAATLKARKSAKAALRTNPAANNQQPAVEQSDDDDF